MKISKLFHWLYAILMFLPFGLLVFNALASMWSGNVITLNDWQDYLYWLDNVVGNNGITSDIYGVFDYLIVTIFGFSNVDFTDIIKLLLTYWTCISVIWLVFDVFMYVPLLVHRWIDKAKIE